MNKRELKYRQQLIAAMGGRWLAAIHVENHLNPGVPDLSYVMVGPGHETGWLELKAVMRPADDKPLKFQIEPSQHAWMTRYAHRVPTHFLIKVNECHYLIDGKLHSKLTEYAITEDGVKRLAMAVVRDGDDFATNLSIILSGLTRRERNGS